MGAVVWAAVFGVVIFVNISEVDVSSLNAASSLISNTFVIAPVVLAAFFSISMVAGGVNVISATHTLASFVSIMAALTFISAGILDVTPNFVVVMIVFAAVFFALISVRAILSSVWAAVFSITDTFFSNFTIVVFTAVSITFFSIFTPVVSIWFITAVFFTISCVFTIRGTIWAADITIWDTFSIAFLLSVITAEGIMRNTFVSLVTAFFIIFTAAVFYTSVVLSWAVEGRWITAWFVGWPAFSMAFNLIVVATEMVAGWLAVMFERWATHIIFVFTAANWVSIFVFHFFLIHN